MTFEPAADGRRLVGAAGRDVERGEETRRAVAHVVVGPSLDRALSERQHRLGPVEGLDLGLLVDREDDRPLGRGEIEPDDVADLRLELRIGAELERLDPVRLQARLGPDLLDGRDRHDHPQHDPAGAPVGRPLGRRLRGQGDHRVAVRALGRSEG
jgi:hypothetical protein